MVTAAPVKQNRQHTNHAPPSRPVMWRSVRLHNEDVRRVANDTVRPTLRALSRIDNVIPKITKLERAIKIKEWATKYISDCHAVLTEEKSRMRKLLEDNGIDSSSVDYTGVHPYSIQVSSPTSGQYILILTLLDEVLADIECLWITGLIDIKQHVDAPHQLCRRVRTRLSKSLVVFMELLTWHACTWDDASIPALAEAPAHKAAATTTFKATTRSTRYAVAVQPAPVYTQPALFPDLTITLITHAKHK